MIHCLEDTQNWIVALCLNRCPCTTKIENTICNVGWAELVTSKYEDLCQKFISHASHATYWYC